MKPLTTLPWEHSILPYSLRMDQPSGALFIVICDTGPKRSLGILGSKSFLRWVTHVFHRLMKLRDIQWEEHSWRNLLPFYLPRLDCTWYSPNLIQLPKEF